MQTTLFILEILVIGFLTVTASWILGTEANNLQEVFNQIPISEHKYPYYALIISISYMAGWVMNSLSYMLSKISYTCIVYKKLYGTQKTHEARQPWRIDRETVYLYGSVSPGVVSPLIEKIKERMLAVRLTRSSILLHLLFSAVAFKTGHCGWGLFFIVSSLASIGLSYYIYFNYARRVRNGAELIRERQRIEEARLQSSSK